MCGVGWSVGGGGVKVMTSAIKRLLTFQIKIQGRRNNETLFRRYFLDVTLASTKFSKFEKVLKVKLLLA